LEEVLGKQFIMLETLENLNKDHQPRDLKEEEWKKIFNDVNYSVQKPGSVVVMSVDFDVLAERFVKVVKVDSSRFNFSMRSNQRQVEKTAFDMILKDHETLISSITDEKKRNEASAQLQLNAYELQKSNQSVDLC
jgi:hypothetical protein